jgi:DNA-binding response OmpR family regulator
LARRFFSSFGHRPGTEKAPFATVSGTTGHLDYYLVVLEFGELRAGAMKKAVILIVEKDRTSSQEAVEALREAGFEVVEADGAAAGLRTIYETRPDLIIAGYDLPAVNGEDAFLRLRQASVLPMIAIGRREEVVEMLEMGMDACIVSPPSGREVVARVQAMLARPEKNNPSGNGHAAH